MTVVASRDLRNHTAGVLRQVAEGERVTITVNGRPVAELSPVGTGRPPFLSRAQLAGILGSHQADAGLTALLNELAGETTDALDEA